MKFPLAANFRLLLLFLIGSVSLLNGQTFPEPSSPAKIVNDFADILNPEQENRLEQKLVAFDDSTSTQIAIVTMKDLDGEPASSYAPALAEKWGIGQKDRNNGLLILVSMDNPREVFIATGYGLEEFVPDATAKRIVDDHILPNFKQSAYFEGLDIATTDLEQLLRGTFKGFGNKKSKRGGPGVPPWIIVVFIILMVIFVSSKGGRGGRGRGIRTYGGPGWGGFPIGGFGGGGFGGGSSGGGGFGGFGGGSFGGGGAGGSW